MKAYIACARYLYCSAITRRRGASDPCVVSLWKVYNEGYTISELKTFVAWWSYFDAEAAVFE